jgi:ABC-type glycerol-3-phosphate transport system substrate-binding protein
MNLRPFELTLIIIFVFLAILSLIILSTFDGSGSNDGQATVVGSVSIWGTFPEDVMESVIRQEADINESFQNVSYREISPESFSNELVNAIADGDGPDLMFVSSEMLVEMRRRIQPISYESFSLRDIRNLYLDGAEIFALSDGLYGYPMAIDPITMYWNRDILATNNFLTPPATWESLVNTYFPEIISRNSNRTINRSVVAMGEYQNIRNPFAIISTLALQGGSQMVVEQEVSGYQVRLQNSINGSGDPLTSAVDFYTRFSNPNNSLYSWNRSIAEDRSEFIAGNLAFYFGFGSEGRQLERQNPNLNFDIAEIPQGATDTVKRTYGKFYALSILRSSDNQSGAAVVLGRLGSAGVAKEIADASNLVPVHRAVVAAGSNDTYGRISYSSAVGALGWLSPDTADTQSVFSTMIRDITENRRTPREAATDLSVRLSESYD